MPDLSQSELDRAYAKRALARGDDPEEVIRRIAALALDCATHPKAVRLCRVGDQSPGS